jgi:hypothetical protein
MFRMKVAVVAAVCVAVLVPGALAQERVTATEKGSLLIYPKVEIRFDAAGNLVQDTFITINNDQNAAVDVQMYFVSEACTDVDNVITLTKNEPAYWSVATGQPKGVSPFLVLGDPIPDPEGSGQFILRGYVLAWAVGTDYNEITFNHLYGGATIVNYQLGASWEYNAYAFQRLSAAAGDGVLNLDGSEYDYGFQILLLDFFASGSTAFSGGGRLVVSDTDLTLLIVDNDVRQDTDGPLTTKARFLIWNENEVGFSGTEYCITKWDERLLSTVGVPNHFLVSTLGTDKGRARIEGMASTVCDYDPFVISVNASLLGVAARYMSFDFADVAIAGSNLFGAGTRAAVIQYDVPDAPPTKTFGGLAPARAPGLVR